MAEIESNLPLFKRMGVNVVAASADDEVGARKMVSEQRLSFSVAYGIQDDSINKLGAFQGVRQEKPYIQPAEFILNSEGVVAASM